MCICAHTQAQALITHTHNVHTHVQSLMHVHYIHTRTQTHTHTHTHTCSVVPATFSHLPTIPVMSFPGWFHRHNLLLRPCPSLRPKECCRMPSSLSRASRRRASSAPLSNDLQVARKLYVNLHLCKPTKSPRTQAISLSVS